MQQKNNTWPHKLTYHTVSLFKQKLDNIPNHFTAQIKINVIC